MNETAEEKVVRSVSFLVATIMSTEITKHNSRIKEAVDEAVRVIEEVKATRKAINESPIDENAGIAAIVDVIYKWISFKREHQLRANRINCNVPNCETCRQLWEAMDHLEIETKTQAVLMDEIERRKQ